MEFKTDKQLRNYLTKRVEHEVTYKSWQYKGNKFMLEAGYFKKEFYTNVTYTCDLKELGVQLSRGYGFNGTYEIIAEKKFGETAECISWTVDRLMEIYKLLYERTSRYIPGKNLYDQAISRPLNLKGGD